MKGGNVTTTLSAYELDYRNLVPCWFGPFPDQRNALGSQTGSCLTHLSLMTSTGPTLANLVGRLEAVVGGGYCTSRGWDSWTPIVFFFVCLFVFISPSSQVYRQEAGRSAAQQPRHTSFPSLLCVYIPGLHVAREFRVLCGKASLT